MNWKTQFDVSRDFVPELEHFELSDNCNLEVLGTQQKGKHGVNLSKCKGVCRPALN